MAMLNNQMIIFLCSEWPHGSTKKPYGWPSRSSAKPMFTMENWWHLIQWDECWEWWLHTTIKSIDTSSTAQGGGGSFKNRKPIGEVCCCESGMAAKPLMDWKVLEVSSFSLSLSLFFSLFLCLSLIIYLPNLLIYLSIYLFISLSIYLAFI